jgi:hypothetical protein
MAKNANKGYDCFQQMKKRIILAIVLLFTVLVAIPQHALAASANVYISPSSSTINLGDNVTITVRVNSGADQFDSAKARLNFDSSKLQYVSYSGGTLTTITGSAASSFLYEGFALPPFPSGDKSLFSVTLKSIGAGSASLSLSEVEVLSNGVGASISQGTGSITINAPSSGGGSSGGSTTSPKKTTTPTTPGTVADTTAPALSGEPSFEKEQSTIKMKFTANEAANAKLTYYKEGGEKKELSSTEAKTEHEFLVGQDSPLEPGVTYKIELILTDAAGNASAPLTYDVRTKGVTYKVKLVDSSGKVLANYPVQLHSEPISSTTDAEGFAIFEDVTPGEHTLVFDIEGVTVRRPVSVSADTAIQTASASTDIVTLPFQLAAATSASNTNRWLLLAAACFIAGMLLMKVPFMKLRGYVASRLRKIKSAPPTGSA